MPISLTDKNYFEIFIGKRILKEEIFNSKGNIPVYSANVFVPFGFLNSSNINDFSHDYLLWGIDGKFEFNVIKFETKFATTDHCGAIKILNKGILPEYLLYELELQSHILGFDRTLRSSLTNMQNVSVKIPFRNNQPDVEEQEKLIRKYMALKKIKEVIKGEIEELNNIVPDINIPQKQVITIKIENIFDLEKTTNRSNFTKSFVDENKGNIPVYSASKNPNEISYGFVKDNLPNIKYFNNCLTWNIDGSVGKAFFRTGKFTLSEKVIPLILKQNCVGNINEFYVKYVLEKKAVEKGFAFTNKAGKEKIKDIEIEIPLLIKEEKSIPDIKEQEKLARKYEELYKIKQELIQSLEGLYEISIDI